MGDRSGVRSGGGGPTSGQTPGRHRVLFLTDRGVRHQQHALQFAPPELDVIMRRVPSAVELADLLPTAEFIISERNQPVTAAMIEAAPRLRLIVRLGSLSHDIDRDAAEKAGVQVVVLPVAGTLFCAEHALMMTLAASKKLGRSLRAALASEPGQPARRTDEDVFAFNWLGYRDIGTLVGKTVAIVGMGEIGVELARLLRPFRLNSVLYNKRTSYPPQVETELGISFALFEQCLRKADILVSLLPFGPETDYKRGGLSAITGAALAAMQPGAILVHLGSGSVLDERALVDALRTGHLAGAALDTFEYEPLQLDHALVALAREPDSNLLLTPHTAAASASGDRSGDYAPILAMIR